MVTSATTAAGSLSDAESGTTLTVTFGAADGDVPLMACNYDATFGLTTSASCSVRTVNDGNVLSGFFTLGSSGIIPFDATEAQMKTAVESIASVSVVSVSRKSFDNRGGYSWSITFIGDNGDIPALTPRSSLVAKEASIEVQELVKGNQLDGQFALLYGAITSGPIAYNANAVTVKAKLEAITGLGLVSVSEGPADNEGGKEFLITFLSVNQGDVMLLKSDTTLLTGVNAVVTVREVVKGSLARGNALGISFVAPVTCSVSQVSGVSCGSSVEKIGLEVDTNSMFSASPKLQDIVPDYSVQIVRTSSAEASNSATHPYAVPSVSGYFQLSYNNELTGVIPATSDADGMRAALEGLAGVHTVSVTKTYSTLPMSGCVDVAVGFGTVTCSASCAGTCQFASSGMQGNNLVQLGGNWYRVHSSYAGAETTFSLGFVDDSTVAVNFAGSSGSLTGATMYKWGGGYEWSVTFHSVATSSVLPLQSPKHSLLPVDTGLDIRTLDCNKCRYYDSLDMWRTYYLRAMTYNSAGKSIYSDRLVGDGGYGVGAVYGVPKAIPNAPTDVSLAVTSGTTPSGCIEVTFTPPGNDPSNDITSYVLDWDNNMNFANAVAVGGTASCGSAGFGRCVITSTVVITGTPPYRYEFCDLTAGTTYYVRLAARNSVPIQFTDPNPAPGFPDNTNWSATLSAVPADQKPNAPDSVTLFNVDKSTLRVIIDPPARTGGRPITNYKIEWDSANTFDSSNKGTVTITTPSPALINGDLLYDLVPNLLTPAQAALVPSKAYYVRVSAINAIGTGKTTMSSVAVAPASPPAAPPNTATLQVKSSSPTPITDMTVKWDAPTDNGGAAISHYMVEWSHDGFVPEVQVVSLTWTTEPTMASATKFTLSLNAKDGAYPQYPSKALSWSVSAGDLREELLNLGYVAQLGLATPGAPLLGDVQVTRSSINAGKGYAWSITYGASPVLTDNKGDQMLLIGSIHTNENSFSTLGMSTQTDGVRSGGASEKQVIVVNGGSAAPAGYFRLNVLGSFTNLIPATATALVMENALRQLNTVGGEVSVTKVTLTSLSWKYEVSFRSNVGNMIAMTADTAYFTSSANGASVVIIDGDNNPTNLAYVTVPGETPAGYQKFVVNQDIREYVIPNLITGTKYNVFVSAMNPFGYGVRRSVGSATPPKQVPGSPNAVTLSNNLANSGVADSLVVAFNPPASSGGDQIVRYRVELDPTPTFNSPLHKLDFQCPSDNIETVWQIQTKSSTNVVSGTFVLDVRVNGNTYTTDPIPYDAVALAVNETGTTEAITNYNFVVTGGINTITAVGAQPPSPTLDRVLFVGDRLQFGSDTALYRVIAVIAGQATLHTNYAGTNAGNNVAVKRQYGGRGNQADPALNDANYVAASRVHCTAADCLNRASFSGSVQSKLQDLTSAVSAGVLVDRDGPDANNGFIWRVTFLDPAPAGGADYSVVLRTNSLAVSGGGTSEVTVSSVIDGLANGPCSGSLKVPKNGGLQQGTQYYARVFAVNAEGYSLPQAAPLAVAPTVVPGPPTGVTLDVVSSTELKVQFSGPSNNGGDAVTSYKIEYTEFTDPSFANAKTVDGNGKDLTVTFLGGGAPFFKTIGGLVTGTKYYVRVRAANVNGYGAAQASTPSFLNPRQTASAPTAATLSATTDSMLTVSFAAPANTGGDTITVYRVQWDTVVGFNSASLAPNKGEKDVPASDVSTTLSLLSTNFAYYVRVAAINAAGVGTWATTAPASTSPTLMPPGSPHTLVASAGPAATQIEVRWVAPVVPMHGFPCSGNRGAVVACPAPNGAVGGDPIVEYEVEWNERQDFAGSDGGRTSATGLVKLLTGLTSGRIYYIRVLARNTVGSGPFCEKSGAFFCSGSSVTAIAT